MASVVIHDDVAAALKVELAQRYYAANRVRIVSVHQMLSPIDTGLLRFSHSLLPPVKAPGGFVMKLVIRVPYAAVVHRGHGWIYPKKAKALRWVTKEGQVVFASRVRPVKGQPWTYDAWRAMGMRRVILDP